MTSLLSRWTRRRQNVEDEAQAEAVESLAKSVSMHTSDESEVVETDQADDTRLLTADDLPDPTAIEVGGSFARFMGGDVDPAARSAALKALWKQPHYNEIDGLLDYALDYRNQPKLSADASAELANKVFRHIVKNEDETQQTATAELNQVTDKKSLAQVDTMNNTETVSAPLEQGEQTQSHVDINTIKLPV